MVVGRDKAGARSNQADIGGYMTEPLAFTFEDDGSIPNSTLPLLVYRNAVPADPAAIERIFAANGWPPAWRNGVHPFHHFHSSAHEVLGVARGEASVLFGGPDGTVLPVQAGDVVVVPAGVAHCNQGQSSDLLIVGAYPRTGPAQTCAAANRKSTMPPSGPSKGFRCRPRTRPGASIERCLNYGLGRPEQRSCESSIRPCTPCPSGSRWC